MMCVCVCGEGGWVNYIYVCVHILDGKICAIQKPSVIISIIVEIISYTL